MSLMDKYADALAKFKEQGAGGDTQPETSDQGILEDEIDESPDVLDLLEDSGGEEHSTPEQTTEYEDKSALDEIEEAAADQEAVAKDSTQPTKDVEFIRADGKRIKIDYTDRARIKKAFAAEVGMRKFQRERDEAVKQYKTKAEDFDKLDDIYQNRGIGGVVEQLTGRSLDEIVQEKIDRLILAEEKPAEAARLEYEDKLAEERRQRERIQEQMARMEEKTRAELDRSDEAKLESMIQPVFNMYSFAGKLNDPDAEHEMDQVLWDRAIARLEEYPDEVQLTPAIIRKEFREQAKRFDRIINKQVTTRTTQVSATKRKEAKENVQAAVASGTMDVSAKKDFAKKFKGGDRLGALVDVLSGKVKFDK